MRIYAYVSTTAPHRVVRAGEWVEGRPISKHGGYQPWLWGKRDTRRMLLPKPPRPEVVVNAQAEAVRKAMGRER